MPVASTILRRVNRRGRGAVFTAQDFVDLGSRNAVDQALTRLASSGQIRRVDRGVYDLPRTHPKMGPMWPSADAVAQAVAKQTDSQLQVSGASAANALGLSTQVPAKVEYLTDGPSRSIHIGKLVVCLKHAGRVDMLLPKTRAGMAIVALRHMGRNAASEAVLQSLAAKLDTSDKQKLSQVRPRLPGWLGAAIDQVIGGLSA
ncbi:MAG: type IV toxin-antitoxin system AbiEi family antitoxin domain-containing protein [Polyangiaceae bacterium]|nr:type IV toxin-antitoxin system AbiEi family antitoxin domain-containing protein [Polyangiaceae bacterium]